MIKVTYTEDGMELHTGKTVKHCFLNVHIFSRCGCLMSDVCVSVCVALLRTVNKNVHNIYDCDRWVIFM